MKTITALCLSAIMVLAPIKPMLVTTLILVILDLIFGVWAAKKKKQKITSAGLRRTLSKILIYEVLLIVSFLVETYMTGDVFPAIKIVSGFVGIVELKSLAESLNTISGGDLLKTLIKTIGSKNDAL